MNVLVVKANNRPASEAVSSKMYETFMENLEGANVTTLMFSQKICLTLVKIYSTLLENYKSGEELTDFEKRLLAAKQKAMDALNSS